MLLGFVFWPLVLTFVLGLSKFVQAQDNAFKPQPLQPGPWMKMTHGQIWPKPKFQSFEEYFYVLDSENFEIKVHSFLKENFSKKPTKKIFCLLGGKFYVIKFKFNFPAKYLTKDIFVGFLEK